jgi:hypothetical protein
MQQQLQENVSVVRQNFWRGFKYVSREIYIYTWRKPLKFLCDLFVLEQKG